MLLKFSAATGLTHTEGLTRKHVFRRINQTKISHYQDIYPSLASGSLLSKPYPIEFAKEMELANADFFNGTAVQPID